MRRGGRDGHIFRRKKALAESSLGWKLTSWDWTRYVCDSAPHTHRVCEVTQNLPASLLGHKLQEPERSF